MIGVINYHIGPIIVEMHQNAHYTLRRVSEILQEAGANLPDHAEFGVVDPIGTDGDDVNVIVNQYGGTFEFLNDAPNMTVITVPMEDILKFSNERAVCAP